MSAALIAGILFLLPAQLQALSANPLALVRSVGGRFPDLVKNWLLYLLLAAILLKSHRLRQKLKFPLRWIPLRKIIATTIAQTFLECFLFLNLVTLFHPLVTDILKVGGIPGSFFLILAAAPYSALFTLPFALLQLGLLVETKTPGFIRKHLRFGFLLGLILPAIMILLLILSLVLPLLFSGTPAPESTPAQLPLP